jgi:hypothetical protein
MHACLFWIGCIVACIWWAFFLVELARELGAGKKLFAKILEISWHCGLVFVAVHKLWLCFISFVWPFFLSICLSVCLSVSSIQLRRRNRQRSRKEVTHDAGEVKDGTYVLKGCCFEQSSTCISPKVKWWPGESLTYKGFVSWSLKKLLGIHFLCFDLVMFCRGKEL